MKISTGFFSLLVVAVAALQIGSATAATFELGSSAASSCAYQSTKIASGTEIEQQCGTSVMVYDSDTGDVYGCSVTFQCRFLNGTYQNQPSPNFLNCTKSVSLINPQTVDSKVAGFAPQPPPYATGYTPPQDASTRTYWYADKQGAVGVCMFMPFALPSPPFVNTGRGPEICIGTNL